MNSIKGLNLVRVIKDGENQREELIARVKLKDDTDLAQFLETCKEINSHIDNSEQVGVFLAPEEKTSFVIDLFGLSQEKKEKLLADLDETFKKNDLNDGNTSTQEETKEEK